MSLKKLFIVILLFTIFEGILGQGKLKKKSLNIYDCIRKTFARFILHI